jgi:formimidoylglutamate deiminase
MQKYLARDALLPEGWAKDVLICVEGGDIVAVSTDSEGGEALRGPVLPGMANLHSHAFQRGMAGLTEVRSAPQDDFWSWRELMYRFVEHITPAQAQAIALQLYIEMLKHGYTAVAEFHYVHHPAEMLMRHLAAARDAGIATTLLPSLYRWSGFGGKPLESRQRRFESDCASVLAALASLKPEMSKDVRAGIAPHSLRAVDPVSLRELIDGVAQDMPIHIHAAEQGKEVEQCKAALGKRPVEWLLSNHTINARWCVVHATHLVAEETTALAAGRRADLVVLEADHPDLAARGGDAIANSLVFSGASGLVRDVMVAGRWAVRDRRHPLEEAAAAAYKQALRELVR